GSATTGSDGQYTLSYDTGDAEAEVRLEVVVPDGYVPTTVSTDAAGADTRSAVTFATAGDVVDFGLNQPEAFGPAQPDVAIAMQRGINSDEASFETMAPGTATIQTFPYLVDGSVPDEATTHATWEQTGSVWGLDSSDGRWVLTSALLKRYAPVGPGGMGAIYLTDTEAENPNAELLTTIPNAGENPRGEDNGGPHYDAFHDTAVVGHIGKRSLGDLTITPDGSAFYVTNLNDRQLYRVPLTYADNGAPQAGEPEAIELPLDLPGAEQTTSIDWVRPWAVTPRPDGNVYVGLTSTGPTEADLRAYIYVLDSETGDWSTAPVAEFPVGGMERGMAWRYYGNDDVAIPATAQPWIQDETTPTDNLLEQPNSPLLQDAYPQLLLSNIAFDGTGDLVVGIKDRFGDQSGYHAGGTDPTDQSQYDGNAAGDVLRLCATGEGSWAVENNGQCGDATGAGVDNGRGHGGGEFYPGQWRDWHDQ